MVIQEEEDSDSNSEEGYRCCVTKSSGAKHAFQPEDGALVQPDVEVLKADGNKYLQHSRFTEAAAAYSQALKLCNENESASAVLHSNRALAHFKLKQYKQVDCTSHTLHSVCWSRPGTPAPAGHSGCRDSRNTAAAVAQAALQAGAGVPAPPAV